MVERFAFDVDGMLANFPQGMIDKAEEMGLSDYFPPTWTEVRKWGFSSKFDEVFKAIKEDPQTKAIPIALISNYNENTLMQDAINAGAVDYILKYQIDPQDLVEKVNSLAREAQGAAAQTQ